MRAHPRVCGENRARTSSIVMKPGSSPRVRGKPRPRRRRRRTRRLIPACAGKTGIPPEEQIAGGAHPRVCGENYTIRRLKSGAEGSSPRVRGKRARSRTSFPLGRLIPACAGKTYLGRRLRREVRLIPACAGKTRSGAGISRTPSAHPRVCGENHATIVNDPRSLGSSPRVRGKRPAGGTVDSRTGLIPACAGKTARAAYGPPISRAHPRVCGENMSCCAAWGTDVGSSPRVRGKPFPRRGGG